MKFIKKETEIVAFDDNDKEMGHISWVVLNDGVINANHTYVSPDYRGYGVAGKLLEQLVNMARHDNKKIYATCSYVVKMFSHGDEYKDVIDPKRGIGDESCEIK